MNDISFLTADQGIAVADNGVILQFSDSIWTEAESPVTINLNAVQYLSPILAWAVGDNGTILKYNGSAWIQQESPATGRLNDICFTDENHGWAVGNSILFYNGNSWQVQSETGGLKTISFATPDEGWAGSSSLNLHHFYNGEWHTDQSFENGDYLEFTVIQMTGTSTVMLNGHTVEGSGVFYENNGSGWQMQSSGNVNAGISFTDQQHGFGIENRGSFMLDTYPSIYRFTEGVWTKEYTVKIQNMLSSVETIGETEAYVSDTVGFLNHGNQGNWDISNGFTTDSILDIDFTRANNGYFACGTDGIWHYDAGVWTNELKVEGYRFNEIEFVGEQTGWGWASSYKKLDIPGPYNFDSKVFSCFKGLWTEETIPGIDGIYMPVTDVSLSGSDTAITFYNSLVVKIDNVWSGYDLPLSDSITAFRFKQEEPIDSPVLQPQYDYVAGWMCSKRNDGEMKGAIYFNDFMQNDWLVSYETTTAAFNDLCVADYVNIYAVGDHGLIAHFDGQTWTEFEPVTSEDLCSVYVNENNQGWATGKNGTLLQYNGLTWSVKQSNTLNDLYKVSFYQNFGLIGGENGTLISTEPEMPVGLQHPGIYSAVPGLNIFPNPATDQVLIEFENMKGYNSSINLYDLTGRLVFSKTISGITPGKQSIPLNLNNLNNGLYMVKINSENQLFQGKVLIQK